MRGKNVIANTSPSHNNDFMTQEEMTVFLDNLLLSGSYDEELANGLYTLLTSLRELSKTNVSDFRERCEDLERHIYQQTREYEKALHQFRNNAPRIYRENQRRTA